MSVHNKDGQLSCSICQRHFHEVTYSSCFHTFCPQCLHGNAASHTPRRRDDPYRCPICNAPVTMYPNSAGSQQIVDADSVVDDSPVPGRESAYSTRLGEATCDICDDGKRASHQCLQCRERFCEACTNAHLNMKASRYHSDQVIPLRPDSGDDDPLCGDYCPRHPSQKVLFFCTKCNVLVCNICKLLEHESHVTKLLSEEAGKVRERLSSLLRDQSYYLDNLQSRLRKVNDRKYQYPYDLEHEIEKVRKQATKLHVEIEREKTENERELEQHYGVYISRANDSVAKLRADYDERAALIAEAQQLMDVGSDLRFVQNGNYLCKKLQDTGADRRHEDFVRTPEPPYKRFVPGATNDAKTPRLVGIVTGNRSHTLHQDVPAQAKSVTKPKRVTTSKSDPLPRTSYTPEDDELSQRSDRSTFGPSSPLPSESIQLSEVSRFTVPHDDLSGYVYGIAPIAGQQIAWITMLDHNRITLVDKDGLIQKVVDLGEPCEGVASDSDGGCCVTCPVSKSIYHVTSGGEVSPVVLEMTLTPHGLAGWQYFDTKQRTMIEELYVCFTDIDGKRLIFEKPRGRVGVFSFFGQDLGRSLALPSPVRIDVDLNTRMLCISDYDNDCVTVCDKSGKYTTALYTGEEDDDEEFKPLGVCFDHTGHVIIADWAAGRVSRISQNGTLVQHLLTDLKGPQSVAMGDNGLLWVGEKKGKVSVYSVT